MYKVSDFTKKTYRMGEVADFLGVTVRTLRNYDRDNRLKTIRSEGNHRLVLKEDLIDFLDQKGLIYNDIKDGKRDVIYARVSSHDQKSHGDLDRQALFLIEHVPDIQNPMVIKEVGSGLNDQRAGIQKLLSLVCSNEVRNIYITYKDRLTRFGFHYLETVCRAHNVEIIVVKDIKSHKTVEEELVEDMMSLIASFSGKLYGMRSKKEETELDRKVLEISSLIIKNRKNKKNTFELFEEE